MTGRAPTLTEHVIREAGAAAYVACLQAGKVKHRTRNLGLSRPAYDVDYAAAASDAVKQYLAEALPAIATEARRAETQNSGSVHEGAGLKGIAQKDQSND